MILRGLDACCARFCWYFNHSSFPITTMIKVREHGGKFEYVRRVRSFETGELNCKGAESVLDSFAHLKF